jgi:hypothetical protein
MVFVVEKFVVACYGIVLKDGDLLMVQQGKGRWADQWILPGGKLETGESLESCVEREIFEEIGCRAKAARQLATVSSYSPDSSYEKQVVLIFYLCRHVEGGPAKGDGVSAAARVSEEQFARPIVNEVVPQQVFNMVSSICLDNSNFPTVFFNFSRPRGAAAGEMKGMCAMQFGAYIDVEALARYFQSRQNPDGGFCFHSLDESNPNDTCYAVLSLQAIGRKPGNLRVADYLRSYQSVDGSFRGVYAAWFVVAALAALDEHCAVDPSGYVRELCKKHRIHETGYIESQSIFEQTFYLADVLHMLGLEQECQTPGENLAPYIKPDGSIGAADPGLASTCFGLAILQRADISYDNVEKTAEWACEYALSSGGFTKKPVTGLAFMDETYYGLQIFRLLVRQPPYVKEMLRFVAGCQNENGGFRRALASGIAGFETSYYALESLKVLLNVKY